MLKGGLKAAQVTLERIDTLSLRWQAQGDGLLTVPLRSVSVAWTSRMSPDPALTSGPSSFWGGGITNKEAGERLGLRAERQ